MIVRSFVVAARVLCLGVMLGACTPFSGLVSDHWPHWAGGEPNGLPPRRGTPGYEQFISHGQPDANATATGSEQTAVTTEQSAAAGQTPAGAGQSPGVSGQPPTAPAGERPRDDTSATQGGLY